MNAEIVSLAKWRAEHPPVVRAWYSAARAGQRCWWNWARLWWPWL